MLQRIRETFKRDNDDPSLEGLIYVDEAYFGVLHKNVHKAKRVSLEGRGAVGKDILVGVKDRETKGVSARHVGHADTPLMVSFAARKARLGTTIHTSDNGLASGART